MDKLSEQLPAAEKQQLRLGYIRLSDSAPLVVASELGLFSKYGLEVQLQREVSWANLRDKLVVGALDAAQMLAPLPLTTTIGASGLRARVLTGLALSLNGNAITVSASLADELSQRGARPDQSASSSAVALGKWLASGDGSNRLTLASAHSFSCHTFQLHRWLRAGGIDPERDLRIVVLPPEQMVDSLARGVIDGYCVGEPWNTIAVQNGIGAIQATGSQIWPNVIEKVLAVTEQWHLAHPGTHLRLRLALMEAMAWLAHDEHRLQAASVLSAPQYLDLPARQLLPSLSGNLQLTKNGEFHVSPHFHVFGRFQAGFPWRSTAEQLLRRSYQLLGRSIDEDELRCIAQQSYRTDLYRVAASYLGIAAPRSDYQHAG